jgi:hypothetical protein
MPHIMRWASHPQRYRKYGSMKEMREFRCRVSDETFEYLEKIAVGPDNTRRSRGWVLERLADFYRRNSQKK